MFTENLPLPNKISYTKGEKENEKILTMEPFFKGYGTTIGNALRRVLLSSLDGAAITTVKFKGVNHEFSTIKGVKEDVVDIILNLKRIRFKLHTNEPTNLKLKVKGAKVVTAKDFEKSSDVEVISTDYPIATLSDKTSELDMEVIIEKGRGYDPVEERVEEKLDVDTIAIDAIFSPVLKVSLTVSEARIGQEINYDKLTMAIETDGTITPEEAVEKSSLILVEHFEIFGAKAEKSTKAKETKKETKKK